MGKRIGWALGIAAAAAAGCPARAATYTDSYSPGGTTVQIGGNNNNGSQSFSIATFKTALGTLNSVTFTTEATATISVPTTQVGSLAYTVSDPITLYTANRFVDFVTNGSGTTTVANGLAVLTATGTGNQVFTGGNLALFLQPDALPSYFYVGPPTYTGVTGIPFQLPTVRLSGLSARVTFDYTAVGGAVPEPATWAMLALGFGLAGAALRRGRGVRRPA